MRTVRFGRSSGIGARYDLHGIYTLRHFDDSFNLYILTQKLDSFRVELGTLTTMENITNAAKLWNSATASIDWNADVMTARTFMNITKDGMDRQFELAIVIPYRDMLDRYDVTTPTPTEACGLLSVFTMIWRSESDMSETVGVIIFKKCFFFHFDEQEAVSLGLRAGFRVRTMSPDTFKSQII